MATTHGIRRRLLAALCGVVAAAGFTAFAATPAHAVSFSTLTPTNWAYVDSRTPTATHIGEDVDAPVGSWRDADGKHHQSRSYFTYDLRALRGLTLVGATEAFSETQVFDCSHIRAMQLWTTAPITASSTWRTPPAELAKVADVASQRCPADYYGVPITDAIRSAIAAGEDSITLEWRVPDDLEGNPHLGRFIDRSPKIYLQTNTVPGVPTDLRINQTSCEGPGPRFVNRGQIVLNATGADDDNDPLNVTFAVWKVADPADRHEYTTSGGPGVRSVLWLNEPDADNTEYSWAVRASDDTDVSAWSAECRFTTDFVGPAIAPVVTSTDYPNDGGRHGGVGIPGTFTFDAAGDPDTVGFHFETVDRQSYVAADHAGGSATVEYTPTTSAPQMTVQAVDRAGNFSPATVYRFFVADTTPLIEDLTPDVFVGDPHTLKLTSRMPGVTSYSYRLDYGSPSTVAAEADGSAVLSIVPPVDGVMIHFAARTTAGLVSPEGYFYLQTSSAPVISAPGYPADGSPGPTAGSTVSFTFHPHVRGVVAYAYTIDNGPEQTVPAEPDGTATIRYTTVNGAVEIYVYSLTADGTMSEYAGGYYLNTSIAPEVGSADYPAYQTAGAPGVTGAFTFGPGAATGVTAYTYQFSGGPEQPVTADGTGHATVAWTPTAPGWYSLVVRSITASGTQSDAYFYSFAVGSGT